MQKEKRQFYLLLSAVCLFFSTNEINKSVDNNDFNSANASVRVIFIMWHKWECHDVIFLVMGNMS